MAKMGRPKAQIDKAAFEALCKLQCTEEEICDFFGITDKTLVAWCKENYGLTFSEVFRQKRGAGKISLRRMQLELAKKNATMAIWLGKQWLGQRDNVDVTIDAAGGNIADVLEEHYQQRKPDTDSGCNP